MPDGEKSVQDVFAEGINARRRGDAIEDNPYPVASRSHGVWFEGWRTYDVLQRDPAINAQLFGHLTRGKSH